MTRIISKNNDQYISGRDTLSRLVALETKICLKFEELDKALVLARGKAGSDTAIVDLCRQ